MRLSKEYFSLSRDIYLCFTSIARAYSSCTLRHNLDILSLLETDISYYSSLGEIMICGDTNARTGIESDYVDNNNKYISIPHYTSCQDRKSKDLVCSTRGKELIDLCIAGNLHILNGSAFGDIFGDYTCFQCNGTSVVDYSIVSGSLYRNILYFHVQHFKPLLSDHAMMVQICLSVIDLIKLTLKLSFMIYPKVMFGIKS